MMCFLVELNEKYLLAPMKYLARKKFLNLIKPPDLLMHKGTYERSTTDAVNKVHTQHEQFYRVIDLVLFNKLQ